jgi:hypothetical protein
MALHHTGKDYRLDVEGRRAPGGAWQIDATLRFRRGTHTTIAERLFGPGRLAMLQAIVEEGAFGRAQGATSVLVHVDIDGEVRDMSLDDLIGPAQG